MEKTDINLIYLTLAGSHLYGLNGPESDIDMKGIAIAQRRYYTGFSRTFEQIERKERKGYCCDLDIYNITKLFNLLGGKGNPNLLELLYADESCIVFNTYWGMKLREIRDLFLSKRLKHSFSGFAISQLNRIKTHRNWLLQPPKKKPERCDFGMPIDRSLIKKDDIGAFYWVLSNLLKDHFEHEDVEDWLHERLMELPYLGLIQRKGVPDDCLLEAQKITGASDNFIQALKMEQAFINANRDWEQYQNWIETRNPYRHELELKFGYDTKHAIHLCRLLKMCREILTGKGVIVNRRGIDAEEILAIKNGAWPYEKLIEWAEKEDLEMNELYKTTALPKTPDIEKLDAICVDMVEDCCDGLGKWQDWEKTVQDGVLRFKNI